MGICWYCHWGWAKPVAEIYKAALGENERYYSVLHFSAGHIVWEDENFHSAEWCLENFDGFSRPEDYSKEELDILRWSLTELAKIPLEIRCPEPEDYDDEHPENYPPSVEVVKV